MQLPRHDPNDHAGVSERATSSIRYASIRSPTFRSLKFSTPIPPSNPSRTSRTSSLKRLSEDSVPSYTSTPSRTTRTRAVRGMTPERTKLPAIVPTFAILNSWRTSASPKTTSFFSGASRPAIAALRSEEHTSELQSQSNLVCRLLLEKKKNEQPYQRMTDSPNSTAETAELRKCITVTSD